MSIWTRIIEAVSALAHGEGLSVVFDNLLGRHEEPQKSVAFTIAAISLAAKMAKADGHVTKDEVVVFRQLFSVPPEQEQNAAWVFNLARQDVAGFEAYAAKIAKMFCKHDKYSSGETNHILIDLLEALFQIAVSDGRFHPEEDRFLHDVALIFGLNEECYRMIKARMVEEEATRDPYAVLGVRSDAALSEIHAAWRLAVKESHPDRMIARGVPVEAVRLAERRLVAINAAWEEISSRKAA